MTAVKFKAMIKDNISNLIYSLEFPTQQHAENFVENENIHMTKQYEIININRYGGLDNEEI